MSNREAAINMLKETANTIMGTLTLVLQVSMNMIEVNAPDHAEEEHMPQLTSQLQAMCQEMSRQRALLQRLAESQNKKMPAPVLPLMDIPVHNMNTEPMPNSATLSDEDDDFSVVSPKPTPSATTQNVPKMRKSPTKGSPTSTSNPAVPNKRAYPMQIHGDPAPMHLTLAEWGQRKVTWGKKHPGHTYFQVLSGDMGYFEWSLQRYNSLPPHQQDFVHYCRAQLEADADQDRLKAMSVRRLP